MIGPQIRVVKGGFECRREMHATTFASRQLLGRAPSRPLKNRLLRPIFVMCAATRRSMGRIRRRAHAIGRYFVSFSTLQADSPYRRQNLGDANESGGGSGQDEEPFDQRPATMARLARPADGLDPAERLLDLLSLDRADAVARMPGRARIDGRTTVDIVLRDMRDAAARATAGHEAGGVIVLVAADRAAGAGIVLDHVERSLALRRAVGLGQARIDDEPVEVLRHQMAHVTELGLLAGAFAKEPGIGISGRGMRVVLALLAMEVALGVAPAALALVRGRIAAVLRHEP